SLVGSRMIGSPPGRSNAYLKNNEPQPFRKSWPNIFRNSEDEIEVFMQEGEGKGTAWGCDLTYEYVKSMRAIVRKKGITMGKQSF
ncbi:hypothetical protein PO124_23035, partial [Bacillus licheniformis]|nr:hypothetical protein [Bacillus licheniformis]